MSNDHTKPPAPGASLDKQTPIVGTFNNAIALEDQVATLSPEARDKCRMIRELSAERLETEQKSQQRSHGFRVLRAKVNLLEDYIRHPALRPPGVQADPTHDLKIIHEQAERSVSEREAHYLRNIGHEADANIRQIITKDRQGHGSDRADARHDHEQGH